jgi:hypothetical protein
VAAFSRCSARTPVGRVEASSVCADTTTAESKNTTENPSTTFCEYNFITCTTTNKNNKNRLIPIYL